VIPEHPSQIRVVDVDLDHLRRSYLKHAVAAAPVGEPLGPADVAYLAEETRTSEAHVKEMLHAINAATR
jgi:hypothetical protein